MYIGNIVIDKRKRKCSNAQAGRFDKIYLVYKSVRFKAASYCFG